MFLGKSRKPTCPIYTVHWSKISWHRLADRGFNSPWLCPLFPQCSLPPIRSLFFEIIMSFRFHSFEAERENFWWSNHGTIQISWRSPSRPGQDMADGRYESWMNIQVKIICRILPHGVYTCRLGPVGCPLLCWPCAQLNEESRSYRCQSFTLHPCQVMAWSMAFLVMPNKSWVPRSVVLGKPWWLALCTLLAYSILRVDVCCSFV